MTTQTSAVHTAGCERCFSIQNKVLTKFRNRLTVGKEGKLMSVKLCNFALNEFVVKALSVWRKNQARRLYTLNTV